MGSAASGAEGRYSRPTCVTVWLFAVGHNRVDFKHLQTLTAVARPRAFPSFVARTDRLGCLRYANRVGAELANAEPDRGFAGDAAPRAEPERQRVARHLEARQAYCDADGAETGTDHAAGRQHGSRVDAAGQRHDGR